MTTGEHIKELITADNYVEARKNAGGDSFIDFVKDHMQRDYTYFQEREEDYQHVKQGLIKLFT